MRRQRIQTGDDGGAVQAKLSMLTDGKPAVTPQNGSGVVPNAKPPRLKEVAVSVTSATVRRRLYEAETGGRVVLERGPE